MVMPLRVFRGEAGDRRPPVVCPHAPHHLPTVVYYRHWFPPWRKGYRVRCWTCLWVLEAKDQTEARQLCAEWWKAGGNERWLQGSPSDATPPDSDQS